MPTRVYVFDDQEVWDQLAPRANLDGYFFQDWRHAVMAINAVRNHASSRETIQHEYVHKILRLSGAMYPLWYNEGLAEFLSTATVGKGTVKLGMPPARAGLLRIAQPDRFVPRAPVGSHIARDHEDDPVVSGDVFYARAWARVDYLHLAHVASSDERDHRERLYRFLRLLNQDRAHDEAFAEAFGMSVAQFDERVDAYLRQDQLPLVTIQVDVPPGGQKARVRPMYPAEVASALGELALRNGKLEPARALFEQASAGAPSRDGHARTLAALAWVHGLQAHPDDARRLFESALELAPKDPIPRLDYAGYLLALADGAPPAVAGKAIGDARAHLGAALELAPDLP
jgi:tetratricopeptide (TPR) repeat protein